MTHRDTIEAALIEAACEINELASFGIGETNMCDLRQWTAQLVWAMAEAEKMRPRLLEGEPDRRAGTAC